MSGKKAIFLDIDGTLISGGLSPFPEDLNALEEAGARGHFLFLNSGRSFANIPETLLSLPPITGIAAGGGSHILLASPPGSGRYETIYRRFVSVDILSELVFLWVKSSRVSFLEGERDCYVVNGSGLHFNAKPPVSVHSPADFVEKSRGDYISKITMSGFPKKEERDFLETHFTINAFPTYSEGIIKGENKAKAMELILKELGLGREDSIAIGDGENDLDMIRFAGLGIAVGNACASLKAAAAWITAECGKGGVKEALEKFVL